MPLQMLSQALADRGFYVFQISSNNSVIIPPVIPIPAGKFIMGHDPVLTDNESSESQKQFHLNPYCIGKYPVTVAEYACAVAAGIVPPAQSVDINVLPSRFKLISWEEQLAHLEHPVVEVSWEDGTLYIEWLRSLTGIPWRYPTEAEWEKAARGEHGNIYPWGNAWQTGRAHFKDEDELWETCPIGAHPLGSSPYGVQDLIGNVWEMTSTTYREAYPYDPYDQNDNREDPNSLERIVLRGGGWIDAPPLSATDRTETNLGMYIGFRLACAL